MRKKITVIILILFMLSVICLLTANLTIENRTEKFVYGDISKIPFNKVGLLLGTSKKLANGKANLYFQYRILAATELYNAHKIKYIVISGDNSEIYYNEPLDMKKALLKAGIPDSAILLDYAGFRTYDSVVRIHKIFGQNSFTVISQEFHNKRAIFIAKYLGYNAIGFNAKDVNAYSGFKTRVREKFARVKVFIDLIFNKKPRFLGKKIEIK